MALVSMVTGPGSTASPASFLPSHANSWTPSSIAPSFSVRIVAPAES